MKDRRPRKISSTGNFITYKVDTTTLIRKCNRIVREALLLTDDHSYSFELHQGKSKTL